MISRTKLFPRTGLAALRPPPPPPEPLQVTIREAARLLAYNERTIRRLIAQGELLAIGQGRLRRVPMESLHAYQLRHRTQPPRPQ
jgi:excisionase family DNA binding protein